ncbi:MAG: MarR family transcriptional regulator [Rubrivivax sp.]|nr:MarR family transcriptional regulator [Rubrivivax sp.]MDH5339415.1 MarR family transcriptional regulator [Rubrivivax sp.]
MNQRDAADPIDLATLPGHQIRRLQQIAVGLFMDEASAFDLTPVQFAALAGVANQPGIDQRTLARSIGFDTSTLGGVIDRLERRGLIGRHTAPEDRRVRRLVVTDAGTALLGQVMPAVRQVQHRILDPLSPSQQRRFMDLLNRLVAANNDASRAPSHRD